MKGKLILIPTPIDEENPLEETAKQLILSACEKKNSIFAIEELKAGRRRWLRFGLPREEIENFVLYNEHTRNDESNKLISELQRGKDVYIMSDGGLPAFCDPGKELVELCHQQSIQVTATPFPNSVVLALALSGFKHEKFMFAGFLQRESSKRKDELKRILKSQLTTIIMDTPYRMTKLLTEISNMEPGRKIFLAMDLGSKEEQLLVGKVNQILKKVTGQKREFILVI